MGTVVACDWKEGDEKHRIVVWTAHGHGIGVAWPDKAWSTNAMGSHNVPPAEWFVDRGLGEDDAQTVRRALLSVWKDVTRPRLPVTAEELAKAIDVEDLL